jgi:myo-inositol 2-dehydrogenase / D-chiro-inositol 1-dehydrogenase
VFKVALFGVGRIGVLHGRALAAHRAFDLRYIVDPRLEAAQSFAAEVGATAASAEAVLSDPQLDAVVIASSTDTHLRLCLAAARAGKAIWCEKPLDLDLQRLRASRPALEANKQRLLMGFQRRFDPHFRALRDRLVAGEIGTLESMHVISHDPAPPPIDYIKVSGGLFKDMAIHDFDIARWLLGEPVIEVFAMAGNLVDPAIGAAGDIDTAKILLRTGSGRLCLISNTRRSGYGYDQRIELYGAKGRLAAGNQHETTVERWDAAGASTDRFENFFLTRYRAAYAAEVEHFADVVAGRAAPVVGLDDAEAALVLAVAAAESVQSGRPVRI